jgi:hypothetical protein
MTTTQKELAMCLSRTNLPVEVRTYISHISRITEQKEETRKKFSQVLDDVSGMGEFLDWIITSNQGELSRIGGELDAHGWHSQGSLGGEEQLWRERMYHTAYGIPAENSYEALVEWSKCWEVEWVLSVVSDSHEVLYDCEHENRTMSHNDIWRLYCYPSHECDGSGAPALFMD